jgi:hypothetical protein
MTTEKNQPKIDWSKPVLRLQSRDLGEPKALRNATPAEVKASRQSAADGQDGYIEVDGQICYVEE